MRKYLILFLLITSVQGKTQIPVTEREATIKSFLDDVFNEDSIPVKLISDKYMYWDTSVDVDHQKRLDMLKEHLTQIKEKNSKFYTSDKISITPYSQLATETRVPFDESAYSDIYAVFSDQKLMLYVYMKENRVCSFDYIQKGMNGSAYFITY